MSKLLLPDAGPLIALGGQNKLWLLVELYDEIVTTDVVLDEVRSVGLPTWIEVTSDYDAVAAARWGESLDPGESSVLALARRFTDALLLIDDGDARTACVAGGHRLIGTVGIVALAQRAGLISDGPELLDALVADGLWASESLIASVKAQM